MCGYSSDYKVALFIQEINLIMSGVICMIFIAIGVTLLILQVTLPAPIIQGVTFISHLIIDLTLLTMGLNFII